MLMVVAVFILMLLNNVHSWDEFIGWDIYTYVILMFGFLGY